jgi:hypothetical protein
MMKGCSNCGAAMDTPHFYQYVEKVWKVQSDEPVPVFCTNGCMINFVAAKTGSPRPLIEYDYQRYLDAHR